MAQGNDNYLEDRIKSRSQISGLTMSEIQENIKRRKNLEAFYKQEEEDEQSKRNIAIAIVGLVVIAAIIAFPILTMAGPAAAVFGTILGAIGLAAGVVGFVKHSKLKEVQNKQHGAFESLDMNEKDTFQEVSKITQESKRLADEKQQEMKVANFNKHLSNALSDMKTNLLAEYDPRIASAMLSQIQNKIERKRGDILGLFEKDKDITKAIATEIQEAYDTEKTSRLADASLKIKQEINKTATDTVKTDKVLEGVNKIKVNSGELDGVNYFEDASGPVSVFSKEQNQKQLQDEYMAKKMPIYGPVQRFGSRKY